MLSMDKQKKINPISSEEILNEHYISSLAKGMQVLEAFGTERQRLSVGQVAAKTKISRTAVRRYLYTFKYLGYLSSDGTHYWITHKVLRFSSAYLNSSFLPKLAQPYLNALNQMTDLSFSIVVLDGHEVVPVAHSVMRQNEQCIMPYGIHLGNRLPAHATSTGKLLLSYLSSDELQQWIEQFGLKRLTPYSIIDEDVFKQRMIEISQQDYCLSKEEHELGVIAIAVPLLSSTGHAIAALNCISTTNQIDAHDLYEHILPKLRQTAQEIRYALN
ncbi:helix-turn-helix domain-containing protein [Acinetobacter qingfengensis]|nr:IclR family transcriptional regulator C-terminal domain-containing protein [Acinetobacter qingfengensis]KAA8731331.1 helix-turn-helix domain-containing protein [Acinetobacter qingfengensis]